MLAVRHGDAGDADDHSVVHRIWGSCEALLKQTGIPNEVQTLRVDVGRQEVSSLLIHDEVVVYMIQGLFSHAVLFV